MKILIVGCFKYEMYAPAFYNAWKELGHVVRKVDYQDYHFGNISVLHKVLDKIQDRYHYGFFMKKYNKAIIDNVDSFRPDFVFLYRCCHVYESTVKKISNGTVLLSYNNDDPFSGVPSNSYYQNYIADSKHCDINYVYRKKNINDFKRIGVNNTRVLLPYYLNKQIKPLEHEKEISLAFMGHYENDGRDETILRLIEAGLPIVVYGDSLWKQSPLYNRIEKVIRPQKRGTDYYLEMNKCMICLVFLSKINSDTYTRRCFEIPAASSMMLSQFTDDLNELFPEDEAAVYFRNNDDLINKCKYYLSHTEKTKEITLRGNQRLKQIGGSEIDRCKEILADVNEYIRKV